MHNNWIIIIMHFNHYYYALKCIIIKLHFLRTKHQEMVLWKSIELSQSLYAATISGRNFQLYKACALKQGHSHKKIGGVFLWLNIGFGRILCISRLLQQEQIHLGVGLNPEKFPKYAHALDSR